MLWWRRKAGVENVVKKVSIKGVRNHTAPPPVTTAVSDASQQSYNWNRMNRGM